MSATNQVTYSGEKQFLRFTELLIKDFNKNTKTTIPDDFEIEFEYFKTLDQTQEDDSGKITIYGLKDETIGIIEQEGGEVWLRCGYQGAFIDTLFVAYISRVTTEKKKNTTATTIECSANLMTHFFAGYVVSDGSVTLPLLGLLKNLGTSLGFPSTQFNVDNVPEDSKDGVYKFLNSYATKNYRVGDLKTIVDSVCDAFGVDYHRVLIDGVDSAEFSFSELGLKKTLKKISSGYSAIDMNDKGTQDLSNLIYSTRIADEGLQAGVVLTKDTGLIESHNEYQIITAFADQKLNANEEETEESIYKRNNTQKKKTEEGGGALSGSSDSSASPANTSNNGFVSNTALRGLTIKPNKVSGTNTRESTAGGQAREATVAFAFVTQNLLGSDLIYFSAFNDKYHQDNSPTSNHISGKAFDVTIHSGKGGAAKAANLIRRESEAKGFKVKVDDEYNFPSSKATAGHLHVTVYGRSADGNSTSSSSSPASSASDENGRQEDFYGRTPIEINRRYNKITTLLNPLVKPQSLVFTKDKKSDDYLVHRVRHASYKGNNKRSAWTMLLYCEDTETKKVSSDTLITDS